MKKLSIITICYNEPRLEDTCRSVVNQSSKDFEWIVIDGGSNKETQRIWDKYKNYITFFISEKDSGIYNAMNKGILHAQGEWILFLNAGDTLYDNYVIQKVLKYLNKNVGDVFYGDAKFILDNKETKYKNLPEIIDETFLFNDCIAHQSAYISKDLFLKYGFYDESYKIVADWEKWIAFLKNGARYVKLPFICAIHRYDGVSAVQTDLLDKERHMVLDKYEMYGKEDYHRKSLYNISTALNPKVIIETPELIKSRTTNKNIKISVIIPIYNVSKYVKKCLDSVISQTEKDIEIICIDDSSTDDSLEIIKKYAEKDSRITIYSFKQNIGVANIRNFGMSVAKGEYFSFIDGDDYIDKDFLLNLYNNACEDIDIVKGNVIVKHKNKSGESNMNSLILKQIKNNNFVGLFWQHEFWSGLYKKNFLQDNNIQFPLISNGEDVIFILKVLQAKPKIKVTYSAIYYYVQRGNSASNNITYPSALHLLEHYNMQLDIIKSLNLPKSEYIEYCQKNIVEKIIEYCWSMCSQKLNINEKTMISDKINYIFKKMICFDELINIYKDYYQQNYYIFEEIGIDYDFFRILKEFGRLNKTSCCKLFCFIPLWEITKRCNITKIKIFHITIIKIKSKHINHKKVYLFGIPILYIK